MHLRMRYFQMNTSEVRTQSKPMFFNAWWKPPIPEHRSINLSFCIIL